MDGERSCLFCRYMCVVVEARGDRTFLCGHPRRGYEIQPGGCEYFRPAEPVVVSVRPLPSPVGKRAEVPG